MKSMSVASEMVPTLVPMAAWLIASVDSVGAISHLFRDEMLPLKHVIVLNVISETCDSTEMLSLKHVIVLKCYL